MLKDKGVENRNAYTTPDFSKNLDEDIAKYLSEGKTIEAFLKAKNNLKDIFDYDFDIKEKDFADFGFRKVRGNINLIAGNIRTFKESQKIIDEAINFDYSSLINYKP